MRTSALEHLIELVEEMGGILKGFNSRLKKTENDLAEVKKKQRKLDVRLEKLEAIKAELEEASKDVEVMRESSVSRGELKRFKKELQRLKKRFSEIGIVEV